MNDAIGFVGLGAMGVPIARRLIESGHALLVCDRDAARTRDIAQNGAQVRATPLDVAHAAGIVFVCLPGPEAVLDVALGDNGLGGGERVRIVIDLSTTGPRMSEQVAQGLARRGVTLIDAPVSGGRRGAAAGSLTVMAAGPQEPYAKIEPLLRHLGQPTWCGERAGQAQLLKVINNMMSVSALAITAEAVALGRKAGIDARLMLDVINRSSGRNSATDDKFPHAVLTKTFDFGFSIRQSLKDVGLCLAEADAMRVPMPVSQLVRQMLVLAGAEFGFDADFTHLARLTERWAHLDTDA